MVNIDLSPKRSTQFSLYENRKRKNFVYHIAFCKSKAEFARLMDEKPQTVSNWVARGAGRNVLDKIISKFPQINANWLITGEGKMLNEVTTTYPSENIDTDTYINDENINEIPQYEMPTINEMIKVISLLSEQGKENAQANKINAEANK